uniref:Uncharacterized protein n=1 Tax=Oryza meridionalis TaxID=40149 RepID=A0A0E0D2J8_9ORYZ
MREASSEGAEREEAERPAARAYEEEGLRFAAAFPSPSSSSSSSRPSASSPHSAAAPSEVGAAALLALDVASPRSLAAAAAKAKKVEAEFPATPMVEHLGEEEAARQKSRLQAALHRVSRLLSGAGEDARPAVDLRVLLSVLACPLSPAFPAMWRRRPRRSRCTPAPFRRCSRSLLISTADDLLSLLDDNPFPAAANTADDDANPAVPAWSSPENHVLSSRLPEPACRPYCLAPPSSGPATALHHRRPPPPLPPHRRRAPLLPPGRLRGVVPANDRFYRVRRPGPQMTGFVELGDLGCLVLRFEDIFVSR